MIYLILFYEFFKIGLFSIGGGLATLPFLYSLADKYAWFSKEMLVDMIAISESTPGPIGVNMATYAGYAAGGVLGGVVATIGIITPSFFVIIVIARVLVKFQQNKYVKSAFYGLRPAVTALVASAGISIINITILNIGRFNETGKIYNIINYKQSILFFVLFLATIKFKKMQPVLLIGIAAIIGIVFKF